MAAPAKKIEITADEREALERVVRSTTAEARMVERSRIVLAAGEGRSAARIADDVGCAVATAKKWRDRFEKDGLFGLNDLPRPGKPLIYGPEVRARLIAKACTRPEPTAEGLRRERWTYEELGSEIGMSGSHAHQILAEADVKPHLLDQWVVSEFSEEFNERAADVCGLYLDPPEGAVVLSVDEKSGVQAKGLARPDIGTKQGKPARRDNEYVRNGTQNLFAALKVHAGEVSGMASKTRNRHDFIAFLDQLEAEIPSGKEVIAILDNLSTHKTREVEAWLDQHPRWRFQFTPTHASWLNQIEIFFSTLQRKLIRHGVFDSEADLAEQMLAFIEHYNQTAKPFNWTYTGKVLVA